MRTIVKVHTPRLSKMFMGRKLHEKMENIFEEATKAFITEAILHVPIETGMSKALWIPLARAVKMNLTVTPRPGRRKQKYRDWNGPTEQYKSISLGRELGETAFTLDIGKKEHFWSRPVMKLFFSLDVFHYWLNENGRGNNNQEAWQSVNAGAKVFDRYLEDNMHEMVPDLSTIFGD